MANIFPFYYKNYRANNALQALPFHVHGVFLALLCIEAHSPERGFCLHPDGKTTDAKRLLSMIGRRNYKLQALEKDLRLLTETDTIKFDEAKQAYYFPFLLKMKEISDQRSAAGKLGFAAANKGTPKRKKVPDFAQPFAELRNKEWFTRDQFDAMKERMQSDLIWFESLCIKHRLAHNGPKKLQEFVEHLIHSGAEKKELSDAKTHFNNWLSKNTQRYVRTEKAIPTHQQTKTVPGNPGAGGGSESGGLSKF